MKTIEEKAKRYDEAIKVAKDIRNGKATYIPDGTPVIEALFPELKESEDENIKKALITYHSSTGSTHVLDKFTSKQICDWLEKQDAQPKEFTYTHEVKTGNGNIKSLVTKKVQLPKFKVGDVIRLKGSTAEYTIESISGECYHGKGWELHINCDDDYELVEQKPSWSEDDNKIWKEILDLLWEGCSNSCSDLSWADILHWLSQRLKF